MTFFVIRAALLPLSMILAADGATAQPAEPGRLSGTLDGQSVDIPLDCSSWTAEQRMVSALDDDPYGSLDSNGDRTGFSFSHIDFAGATSTDATIMLDGSSYQIGPAFRAKDDTEWVVDDDFATFDGTSGAAGDIRVSLTMDCARRSAAEAGYTARVTGEIDGENVDAPLFCDREEPGGALSALTREGETPKFNLTVWPDGSAAAVSATIAGVDYQLAARGDSLAVEGDVFRVASRFTGGSDRGAYEVDLVFDCTQDIVETQAVAPPRMTGLLPLVVLPGQRLLVAVDSEEYAPGDRIEIRDEGPGPRDLILIEGGGVVGLTAPTDPGRYRVLYFKSDENAPVLSMEIVVQ